MNGYKVIFVKVDVVPVDVAFLIGLTFLHEYRMDLNTI